MKKDKKEENYLDFVPRKSQNFEWIVKDDGIVQIIVERNSLFERIVRKLFFTPENYKVDLDKIGSFIWLQIDGSKTVYHIAELLKIEFGEDIEPLYKRLLQYINILKNNKFIEL